MNAGSNRNRINTLQLSCGLEKIRMRARFALAMIVASFAGLSAADAADFVGHSGYVSYSVGGVRAPQLLAYDNQPGVYVRTYWSTPWQNRHYYPFTGKKPKVGRHERLNAVRATPEPAETFYREWSTISLYPPAPVTAPPAPEQPLAPLK
jgi:hypothetical protein